MSKIFSNQNNELKKDGNNTMSHIEFDDKKILDEDFFNEKAYNYILDKYNEFKKIFKKRKERAKQIKSNLFIRRIACFLKDYRFCNFFYRFLYRTLPYRFKELIYDKKEEDLKPALINVHGQIGIGKTFLLERIQAKFNKDNSKHKKDKDTVDFLKLDFTEINFKAKNLSDFDVLDIIKNEVQKHIGGYYWAYDISIIEYYKTKGQSYNLSLNSNFRIVKSSISLALKLGSLFGPIGTIVGAVISFITEFISNILSFSKRILFSVFHYEMMELIRNLSNRDLDKKEAFKIILECLIYDLNNNKNFNNPFFIMLDSYQEVVNVFDNESNDKDEWLREIVLTARNNFFWVISSREKLTRNDGEPHFLKFYEEECRLENLSEKQSKNYLIKKCKHINKSPYLLKYLTIITGGIPGCLNICVNIYNDDKYRYEKNEFESRLHHSRVSIYSCNIYSESLAKWLLNEKHFFEYITKRYEDVVKFLVRIGPSFQNNFFCYRKRNTFSPVDNKEENFKNLVREFLNLKPSFIVKNKDIYYISDIISFILLINNEDNENLLNSLDYINCTYQNINFCFNVFFKRLLKLLVISESYGNFWNFYQHDMRTSFKSFQIIELKKAFEKFFLDYEKLTFSVSDNILEDHSNNFGNKHKIGILKDKIVVHYFLFANFYYDYSYYSYCLNSDKSFVDKINKSCELVESLFGKFSVNNIKFLLRKANYLHYNCEFKKALKIYREIYVLCKKYLNDNILLKLNILQNIAVEFISLGKYQSSLFWSKKVFKSKITYFIESSKTPECQKEIDSNTYRKNRELVSSLLCLIDAYCNLGKYKEAYETLVNAINNYNLKCYESFYKLAYVCALLGKFKESIKIYKILGNNLDNEKLLLVYVGLTETLICLERLDEAKSYIKKIIDLFGDLDEDCNSNNSQKDNFFSYSRLLVYAKFYSIRNLEFNDFVKKIKVLYESCENTYSQDHYYTIEQKQNYCQILFEYGSDKEKSEALRDLEEVVSKFNKLLGCCHPKSIKASSKLGEYLFKVNQKVEAIELAQKNIRNLNINFEQQNPLVIKEKSNLAYFYQESKQYDKELNIRLELYESAKNFYGTNSPLYIKTLYSLTRVLFDLKDNKRLVDYLHLLKETQKLAVNIYGLKHSIIEEYKDIISKTEN